jgi:hypothetical protein
MPRITNTCTNGAKHRLGRNAVLALDPTPAVEHVITLKNESAFKRNTAHAPVRATTTPPMAGPTARAKFRPIPVSATADGRSARGTSSGVVACQAGAFIAAPAPSAKVKISSSHGVIASASATAPSVAEAMNIKVWVTISIRRRSTPSARAPAGRARKKIGRVVAVCISAIITGDEVSDVISQPAPASCIHVPIFEVSEASHRARKSGCCNGRQVDALTASECRLFIKCESACCRDIGNKSRLLLSKLCKRWARRERFLDGTTKW